VLPEVALPTIQAETLFIESPVMKFLLRFSFVILLLCVGRIAPLHAQTKDISTLESMKQRGYFTWGADAEGGAPYVFVNPDNPNQLIGYEVDIANEKQLFRLLSIPGIICSICSIICQIYSNQILSVHLKRHYPFEINRIIVESSYPYQTP